MTTLPRLRKTRCRERGASLFIVVLVITVLTAIGIFAARNASQVSTASGYARQATQTLYFAEAATELGIGQIDYVGQDVFVGKMTTSQDYQYNQCTENASFASKQPCYRVLDTPDTTDRIGQAVYQAETVTAPGSFGPALLEADDESGSKMNYGRQGVFMVEFVDSFGGFADPGFNVNDSAFHSVTINVTGFAQIRTAPDGSFKTGEEWCGNMTSARTASIAAIRSYITLPNVAKGGS